MDGTSQQGAGFEMVVGDGGALDSPPDQIAIQTVGQVAAIEPVGPLPQVAREMLGADPMMGADQPGFDVAEEGVDDWEELAGIGAAVLDHRGVFQILAEIGVAAAAGKPVGQQMRIGGDVGSKKGPRFGPGRGRQHGEAGSTGEEPVLALNGVPKLSAPVLRRRPLFDDSDDQALVGISGAATAACRVAAATDKRLVRAYRGPSDRRQETTWSERIRAQPDPGAHPSGPLRHPSAPGLSLAGVRLIILDHALGLPVLRALSFISDLDQVHGAG
jgi:hypothetical protein